MLRICTICRKRPRSMGSHCLVCGRLYQQLYREYVKRQSRQKPCITCKKHPRDPGQRTCRACDRAYRKKVRPAQRKHMSVEQRAKERTRSKTRALIAAGVLKPQPCQGILEDGTICGSLDVQAHHENYQDAIHVLWVCRECHRAEHGYKI